MAEGKSSAVFSVAVSTASQEGGDPSANHLPQPDNGTGFVGIATTTATTDAFNFEQASHSEEQGRRTAGDQSLEPIGVLNTTGQKLFDTDDGDFFKTGYPESISISHRFKTSKGADPSSYGYGKILGSSMGLYSPPADSVVLSDDSVDGSAVIVPAGDEGKIAIGSPIRIKGPGKIVTEYAICTSKVDTNDGNFSIMLHPALEYTPQNGDKLELCYAYYPVIGASNCALLDFHARFAMGGTGTDASYGVSTSGSRCSGFTISNSEGGASLEMSFRPLVALSDNENADCVPTQENPSALLQHRYGCRVDLAESHAGDSAPFSKARTFLPNLDHTITCEFDISPGTPETRGVSRGTSMEVHNSTCTVSLQTEQNTDLQKMLSKAAGDLRTLILGFGPAGPGQGGAFILKNGGRDSGSANVTGGEGNRIEQETTLRAISDFGGCDTNGLDDAGKRLCSAPFLLVLPKV